MKKLELDKKLKEEGKAEGKEEERRQLILKQYRKGLSVEYIADINEFDVEYVKNVVAKG
jgi:predicted transposase YdaD